MAQLSDYDVDSGLPDLPQQVDGSSASALASSDTAAIDSSSFYHPLRPSLLTSDLDKQSTNAQVTDLSNTSPSEPAANQSVSTDLDGFYRRYRDSFRTREPGGAVYALPQASLTSTPDSMASVLPSRALHLDGKPTSLPSESVTVRLNNLTAKTGQDGTNTKREPATLPRGRQASVKAFVSKFEQRPDEIISTPDSKPGSRSTSVNNSARTFRSRTPSRVAEDRYSSGRRKSGTERMAEQPLPLNIKKRTPRKSFIATAGGSAEENFVTKLATAPNNGIASQSIVNHMEQLEPTLSSQRPLFGEVIAGHSDFGWGIPNATLPGDNHNEQNIQHKPIFRDDTHLELSPSSPSAWYQEPTFEGFDSSRMPPRPEQQIVHHRRSKSDLQELNHPNNASHVLPSSEIAFSQAPETPTRTQQRSVPALSRSLSYANDSHLSGNMSTFAEHASRETNTSSNQHNALSNIDGSSQVTDISPSAKSPPLRNSRNRPSVSEKLVERTQTVGSTPSRPNKARKNVPEIGTVDFAARRERIQRAFSKSVEAKEAEQRRSLILEAQRRKHQPDEIPPVPPMPSTETHPVEPTQQEDLPEAEHPRKDSETLASMSSKTLEGPLGDVNTVFAQAPLPPAAPFRRELAEDSPTLGSMGQFPIRQLTSSTPSDAESSDSNSNYFDSQSLYADPQNMRNSVPSAELSTRPQPESIHIVLGENQGQNGPLHATRGATEVPFESRWSMSSWTSSNDSIHRYSATDTRLESIEEAHDGQDQVVAKSSQEPQTPASETGIAEGSRPGSSSKSSVGSGSKQWMVDQSIVPPRSFAQDTGTTVASGRTTPAGGRQTQSPRSEKTASPTGLRKVERTFDVKQTDRLSPSDTLTSNFSQRASLMNPADFVDASPSIGDWIAVQAQDTPVEEKSFQSFAHKIESSQPKKVTGLRPRTPKKLDGPLLPEIQSTEGGLGIDIDIDTPNEGVKTRIHHNTPDVPLTSSSATGQQLKELPPPVSSRTLSASPSRGLISKYNTQGSGDLASSGDVLTVRPISKGSRSTLDSEEPKASSAEIRTSASEQSIAAQKHVSEEEQKAREAEQKRLTRRKNIIKELVDTESSFGQDMTVVVDIYKETSHVILQSPEDVKILFGNAAEVVAFSTTFLDSLKGVVSPVYKLPRSKRWRTKRDSSATAESSLGDETSSISNLELTEDERDRMTSVGTAFEQNLTQMEKVYTDYLKNHEQANARLAELMKSDKVQIWLKECKAYAHDLTTAWSLDSLLVKPVQRILKYPLLLKELADVTPENHPDFVALDSMTREIVGVSKRINAAKKRADLVEQAHGLTAKKDKRKKDERSGFAKAFGRKTEKFKQQVGLSDIMQDRIYNMLADKFGSHFFQVQVVMRDIEMYTVDVQSSVKRFESFVVAMEEHMDVAQSPYPEIQSKWRVFRLSVAELQATALTDHVTNVREHVIEPMKILLKYYEGPQRMMEKRKKRILDHAKWKQMQDSGSKIDKKLIEQGEQFVAINETLKEELPQLFGKTKQLVEHCLNIFVQLQLQWQTIWRRKLGQAVDARHLPKDAKDIMESFSSDFKYTEAQVLSLAICNGALKDDDSLSLTHTETALSSSNTTLNGDDSASRQTSLTYDDVRDSRHLSHSRNRATSANSQTAYQTAAYYPAAYAQAPTPRGRSGSTTSGRRNEHHQWGSQNHLGISSPPPSAPPSGRPSSQSTRGNSVSYGQNPYDPSSYNRYSDDSNRSSHWYSGWSSNGRNSQTRPIETQYGLSAALAGAAGAAGAAANPRGSAIFSSALPPSDGAPPTTVQLSQPQVGSQTRFDLNTDQERHVDQAPVPQFNVLFLAASVYEFNIDRARREAGYPYLTYAAGEIFDVIGEKGELWLAKNQDDPTNTLGWIWNKHFAKLASEH